MKQKTTRNLVSVLLTLVMVLGLLPGIAPAALTAESVRYVDEAGRDMGVAMCMPVAQTLETGWYVSSSSTFENRLEVTGDVHLILADNTTLNLKSGIHVPDGAKLTIWAQSTGDSKGKLEAHNGTTDTWNAAIGGNASASDDKKVEHTGEITINGGYIHASGATAERERTSDVHTDGGPGVCGKTVTINGGEVKAYGEGRGDGYYCAAGISADAVVVNGGYVEAYGSVDCGAGIGGGAYEDGCDLTVTGGTVIAKGGPSAPGIGSGIEHDFTKTITVSGGTVKARSGSSKRFGGAGIGSGAWGDFEGTVIISGGYVEAISDTGGGAGIGSGRVGEATDGHVYISGGFVFAKGSSGGTAERENEGGDDSGGAGIGGGRELIGSYIDKGGEGCDDVVITGGTVFAQSGNGRCSAIGHGDNDGHMGNITIGDGMRVQTDSRTTGGVDGPYSNRDGNPFKVNERDGACMYNHTALIHKCDHPMDAGVNDGYADVTADYHQRAACVYCGHALQREAHTLDEENKCTVCGYQGAISTVTFDPNGGSGEMDARKVIPGRTLILPACGFTSPSGKAFAGWEIGGQTYAPGKAVTINADTTVKALWSRAYRLWVGEMQVTEDNAGDILGDGTAVYDRLNNTLTLTDAWIINGAVYDRDNTITAGIISELAGMKIVAEGESIVNTADAAYGVYSVGTLSIGGEGRLNVRGNTGIGTGGDLDVSVSKLIASGEQYGIDATGSITINGSEVSAEGGERGIKATENIGVSGKQSIVIASSTGDGYAMEAGEDIGFDADIAIVSPVGGTVGSVTDGVIVLDENGNAATEVVIAKPVNYRVTVTPVSLTLTYGGDENRTLTASVTTNDESDLGTLSYCWQRQEAKDDWETVAEGADCIEYTVSTDEEPGEYVYRCLVTNTLDGRTEQAASNEVAVTVEKAAPEITAPESIALTYTGSAQALVTAGSATGGTLYYAVTDENTAPADDQYTESIPSATETGTYYVWYKVIGDENHKDTDPVSLTATITADMTALNAKIGEATEYYNSVQADYPSIAETLLAAIDTAKAVTDESQSAVDAAVTALDDAIKAAKAEAKKIADDTAAAKAVEAEIDAIGEVEYTDACKAKIDAARAAYDALTDGQRALVENYDVLTAAEARYAELKAAAETPDNPEEPTKPTEPDKPSQNDNVCRWDNVDHGTSFWGRIVKFFHSILYFFAHLFGRR